MICRSYRLPDPASAFTLGATRPRQPMSSSSLPAQLDTEPASSQSGLGLQIPETLPSRPTRLLLVSHAESMQRRYGNLSLTDTGLTAQGWEQSNALAEWIRTHEQPTLLVSNPQMRCRLTAQRISQATGTPLIVETLFPPSPPQNWMLEPPLQAADDATYLGYQARVVTAFDHLLSNRWGETTLVVTNPNAIVAFLRALGILTRLAVNIDDTGVTELVFAEQRWQLTYLNRREHLPRPALTVPGSRNEPAADGDIREQLTQIRQIYNQLAAALPLEQLVAQVDKTDEVSKEFMRFIGPLDGNRLLEVGSSLGQFTIALARAGAAEVAGVDISPAMLERAEYLRLSLGDPEILRRVSYRLGPAHDLPFGGGSFDGIVCRFLLHHMGKLDRILGEFHRVLRPGGMILIADLSGSDDAVKRATQNVIETKRNPSHATIRTQDQLTDQLQAAGFVVEKEKTIKRQREVSTWLDELSVDKTTRTAVTEMLEASIETDAADLHVQRRGDTLVFEQRVVLLQARRTEKSS